MKKTSQPHVVNVTRDKLVMCTPASPDPLVFTFTPGMIGDMEVTGRVELESGLKTFLSDHKLKPTSLVIILASSIYFEKDYPGPNIPSSADMEDFIDTIPFAVTSSKLFRSGSGFKQIVINRELYESLKKAFEDLGFKVSAVVPAFVLGPTDEHQEVTAETCRIIYKKMDQITANSFLSLKDNAASLHRKEQVFLEKHKLAVVLATLLVLVFAAIMIPITLKPIFQKRPRVQTPIIVKPAPTTVPTPTVDLPSTPSSDLLASLTVQVLNASGRAGQAASLSAYLRSSGLTQIQTGNTVQIADSTSLVMSPKTASQASEFVTGLVQDLYPEVSISTDLKALFDITITLGRI